MNPRESRSMRGPSTFWSQAFWRLAWCGTVACGALAWGGVQANAAVLGDGESAGAWWQRSEVVAALDLQPDQVAKLETELLVHRQEVDLLADRFDQEQDRLDQLMEDSEVESTELELQMRRAIETRGALEVAHGGFLLVIREVLDPVQWQALKAHAEDGSLALDPTRPLPPRPPEPPLAPTPVLAPTRPLAPTPALVPSPPLAPSPRPERVSTPTPAPRAPAAPTAPSPKPVVAPSPAPAVPEPPTPPPAPTVWWHERDSQKRLSLSRRQIEAMDEAASRHAARLEDIQHSIGRVELQLQPIIDADSVDSQDARNKLVELGRARMDLRLVLRDMDLELRGILTSGQRLLLQNTGP